MESQQVCAKNTCTEAAVKEVERLCEFPGQSIGPPDRLGITVTGHTDVPRYPDKLCPAMIPVFHTFRNHDVKDQRRAQTTSPNSINDALLVLGGLHFAHP